MQESERAAAQGNCWGEPEQVYARVGNNSLCRLSPVIAPEKSVETFVT